MCVIVNSFISLLNMPLSRYRLKKIISCNARCDLSYRVENGASLLEIADVLGHKQIQMTKRYTYLCLSYLFKILRNLYNSI